ncbi:hypothetical protein ACFW6E_00365 [Streptomyces olivaceoviridis]|uniref:hypothetical protein n=1 Tax=Streptomyces olivaceoviridis TaxID=1921 RepID=UPI0036D08C43
MAVAIIGLVGALLGALTTVLGAALSERRQARREDGKRRLDQRIAAYDGALRHLLRAANLRSEFMGGNGAAVLKQEHQREWFDDLVQAQYWLHAATRHCETAQLDRLTEAAEVLDSYVALLNSSEGYDGKGFSILRVLQLCIATVTDCARRDVAAPQSGSVYRTIAAPAGRGISSTEARDEFREARAFVETLYRERRNWTNIRMLPQSQNTVTVRPDTEPRRDRDT